MKKLLSSNHAHLPDPAIKLRVLEGVNSPMTQRNANAKAQELAEMWGANA